MCLAPANLDHVISLMFYKCIFLYFSPIKYAETHLLPWCNGRFEYVLSLSCLCNTYFNQSDKRMLKSWDFFFPNLYFHVVELHSLCDKILITQCFFFYHRQWHQSASSIKLYTKWFIFGVVSIQQSMKQFNEDSNIFGQSV